MSKNAVRRIMTLLSLCVIGITLALSSPRPQAQELPLIANPAEFGSLDVSLSPQTPDPEILPAGSVNVLAAVFELTATTERIEVRTLTIRNCLMDADGICAQTAPASEVVETIKLRYPNVNGEIKTVAATLDGNQATFTDLDVLILPGESVSVAITNDVREDAPSDAQLQWALNALDAPFEAHALSSGQTLTESNIGVEIFSAPIRIRATKPTVEPVTSDAPLAFAIAADPAGDLSWSEITFKIDSADASTESWSSCANMQASFTLTRDGEPVDGAWSAHSLSGNRCRESETAVYIHFATSAQHIRAGERANYALQFAPRRMPAEGDRLEISIPFQEEMTNLRFPLDALIWTDGFTEHIDGSFIHGIPLFGENVAL